jgi:glycosyltransferase involved in cell wall biosynthesis
MKPRLLYTITKAEHGGAQAHVRDLLRHFSGRYELMLATSHRGFLTEEAERLGVAVRILQHLVQPLNPVKDVGAVAELAGLMREFRPALVHLHSSKAGMVGRIAARMAGVPSVFTAHGWAFTEGASRPRRMLAIATEWLAARVGQRIIAVSEYDYNLAIRCRVAGPPQMVQVHNGVPDVPQRAQPGVGMPRLVMTARFAPPKDQALVLNAVAQIGDGFKLCFIGEGERMEEALALARHLGLETRCEFLGARDDVPALLAQSHVFVLASNYEGFPISTLEGMRAGLPVVASDVGGVKEAIVEGESGFLFPKGDAEALRQKLRPLIQDPALRQRMGQAARLRYEQRFSLEGMLTRVEEVYREVLGGRVEPGVGIKGR